MTEDSRNAKAEAKAAKAKAKELRPFYMKKRWWVVAVVIVIIVVISAGGGGDEKGTPTSGDPSDQVDGSTVETIGKGVGSSDASDDIESLDCGTPDVLGMVSPKVTVKNNSSKASNYFITVVAESADGSTKYDDTIIFITALGPDQTMTEEGLFTNELPTGAVCKITEVQRTAS